MMQMKNFKLMFTWILGLGFLSYLGFIFVWFVFMGIHPDIQNVILDQWLAMIVFPSACFGALVIVMLLDNASGGDIEFKALGFHFKGASGPIVLWGFLVLILAVSLNLLWQPSENWRTKIEAEQVEASDR